MNGDEFENEKKSFLDKFILNIKRNVNDLTTEGDIVAAIGQLDFSIQQLLQFQQKESDPSKIFHDRLNNPILSNKEQIILSKELNHSDLWVVHQLIPHKKGWIIRLFHIHIMAYHPSVISLQIALNSGGHQDIEYNTAVGKHNMLSLTFHTPLETVNDVDDIRHSSSYSTDDQGIAKTLWFVYGEYVRIQYE